MNIDGLVTGLDTTSIIDGLLQVQKSQIDRFTDRKKTVIDQKSAFKGVEARLLSLQNALGSLTRAGNNAFTRKTVTSSDEDAVTASVSSRATAGTYHLRVAELARSHQIASQSFDSADASLALGTYSIQVGNGTAIEIEVNAGNNTLANFSDAINQARGDVTAIVVAQNGQHRLLLSANESGAANTIDLSFAADPDYAGPGQQVTFDLDNPLQEAKDASILLGSGAGAISLSMASNQVDELIPGMTLNLLQADPDREITLNIARDTETARTAIDDFVTAYNDTLSFIDEQQQFDPETGAASTLFGDRSLLSIRDSLTQSINRAVPGLDRGMNRLTALGIEFNSLGQLSVRSSKLDDALNGRLDGVTLEDVQRVFGTYGTSNTPNIRFLTASSDTQPSPLVIENGVAVVQPYGINITQPAERAQLTAAFSLAQGIVIGESNDTLVLSLDGKESAEIRLDEGTYTPEELATQLQQQINADESLGGREIGVTVVDGSLQLTSQTYGLSSEISIVSGTALATLGLETGQTANGQDVVGSFVANGKTEAAKGNGQILVGTTPGAATDGLQIRVSLTQTQLESDFQPEMVVTRGIGSVLDATLDAMLDPIIGDVKQAQDTFDERIESIDESIERLNDRFEASREALLLEFAKLESSVADLQSAGSFLSAQLGSLPPINPS